MPIINVNLPSDGTGADVADYNGPINAILAVVNGHLAADNMEPGGLDWSVMSGSMSNVIPSAAMQDSGNLEKFRDETNVSLILSGMAWSIVSGLNGTMSSGVLYSLNGIRYAVGSIASRAFTASKDTYVSVSPTGAIAYQETTNGGTMPALSTDYLLIAKVVTGASAITSVVDYRRMSFSGGLRTRKAQFIMLGDNAPGGTSGRIMGEYGSVVEFPGAAAPGGFARGNIVVPDDWVPGTSITIKYVLYQSAGSQSLAWKYYIASHAPGDSSAASGSPGGGEWNVAQNLTTSAQTSDATYRTYTLPTTIPPHLIYKDGHLAFAAQPNTTPGSQVLLAMAWIEYTAG